MESSTIIPSTTIRAARETVFRHIPKRYIQARAIAVQTGTPEDAMSAERMGKSRSITRITTSIDISKSLRKDQTESPTTFGWSVMRETFRLSGASDIKSASTLSTSFPNATILLSGRISMESTRAVWPL